MNASAPDILLVEDTPSEIELFLYAMRRNQSAATLEIARDGVEAMEFLFGDDEGGLPAQRPLPRLVMLDLNLPRLNGFQLLQRLRGNERTRQLPVVIFSLSSMRMDIQEAQRLGANAFIPKPMGFDNLCTTLAQIERDWLA